MKNNGDKLVVIMRGISGAGKSTWLENNYPEALTCSADDYFTDEGYNPAKIEVAHRNCFAKFLMALSEGKPLIAVDNTNIKLWEVSPYYLAAKTFGYKVMVITVVCDSQTAAARNVHHVPQAVNEKYKHCFEPSLSFWPGMVING
jgi:predicted kinase